ncbi:Tripartite ATP-independent periplasmic transporters, DctQ component [Grimontia celer]|uniref:TRAP transporter small permease protein n=1 Tax=Grimontia celer TaxID=1796497 RepID=A0A128F413_9GAMM|nr:TRAP transporter small permease [Grimontia celer]CZF81538.1 Tripartite ATP-independent periplasmic transporters, DctQ component [Grimontia celer]
MNLVKLANTASKASVFIGKSSGVFYAVAIVLAVTEVIARYVFNSPTSWNLEIIMALCGSAWLLSAGAVTQQQRHITVTVMELVVSESVWKWMQRLALVISLFAVAGLIWAAFDPAIHAINNIERSGSAFNPPLPTYFKALLLCAGVLFFIQLLANLILSFDEEAEQ